MDSNKVLVKSEDFVSRKVGDMMMLVPISKSSKKDGYIYSLNSTGIVFWDLIDGTSTLLQIKQKILSEYDVAPEELEAELEQSVDDLLSIGAVMQTP